MRHSIRSDNPSNRSEPLRSPSVVREPFRGRADEKATPERAVLAGVLLPNTQADLRDPLGELKALAESAGVIVVDGLIQKRQHLDTHSGLGKGKLQELLEKVTAHDADLVIMDNDLAPRQIRGIEKIIQKKVLDRSELILDIFACRAKSKEAQLQVELAQLEYTAPRLRGMWTHLERIAGGGGGAATAAGGGVGTRGPGERQIEIDRRIVRDRVSHLKRELAEIDRRKSQEVKARGHQWTVSIVGYTNAGKSTLMNKMTDAGRYAADQLFATLDTKTVRWTLHDGTFVLLSDTVGFIRDIPHHLVASFRATLEEAIHADVLLHIVDASSPIARQQMDAVDAVLADLGCADTPQITVLNKIDVADHGVVVELLSLRRDCVIEASALTGEGLDRLNEEVARRASGSWTVLTLRIPHSAGRLVSEVAGLADVLARRYTEEGVELDVRISEIHLRRLAGQYPHDLAAFGADGRRMEFKTEEEY